MIPLTGNNKGTLFEVKPDPDREFDRQNPGLYAAFVAEARRLKYKEGRKHCARRPRNRRATRAGTCAWRAIGACAPTPKMTAASSAGRGARTRPARRVRSRMSAT